MKRLRKQSELTEQETEQLNQQIKTNVSTAYTNLSMFQQNIQALRTDAMALGWDDVDDQLREYDKQLKAIKMYFARWDSTIS